MSDGVCSYTLGAHVPVAVVVIGLGVGGVEFFRSRDGERLEAELHRDAGRAVELVVSADVVLAEFDGAGGFDQEKSFAFWSADYQIRRPGDYTFFLTPSPYWEPVEDKFIVHYTKVCVNALGLEQGWDQPLGLET